MSTPPSWASTRAGAWMLLAVPLVVGWCFLAETAHALGNFYCNVNITWGRDKVKIFDNGLSLTMSLDNTSGSAFVTYDEFLFGKFDMEMKLIPGNSAGTVTTLYVRSMQEKHDEIDYEFLGNVTGEPYTVHTNIFTHGEGDKEMQFHLWFDPTLDFHTYTILWNPKNVIWLIDEIPIRIFRNEEARGLPFPNNQPMRLYSSLWNADDWATQGGRIKTDWSLAPFTASYRNYNPDACVLKWGVPQCAGYDWYNAHLDHERRGKMRWVRNSHMIYDYCTDYERFPQGVPPECSVDPLIP